VQSVIFSGGLAAIALELAGAAAAVAMAVVAVAASPEHPRSSHRPPAGGPGTLMEVPTQRTASPDS
jgi:hypothetical protein